MCCAEIEHNIGVKSSTFLRRVCCIVCDKCACAVGSINNAARAAPDLKRGPRKRATPNLSHSPLGGDRCYQFCLLSPAEESVMEYTSHGSVYKDFSWKEV